MTTNQTLPRVVVYTAYYGAKEPLNEDVFGGFTTADRVIFTDDPNLTLPGARTVIDPLDGLDPARASRRAKLAPHRYFPEYDWSIYIDNNSALRMDPAEVLARLTESSDAPFFAFRHPWRDCVYREAREVIERGKDDKPVVKARMREYRAMGVPEQIGLITGNFLVRAHNRPELQRFGDRWYEQVLAYSRRDQLSFPFLRDLLGLDVALIEDWPIDEMVQIWVYTPEERTEASNAPLPDRMLFRARLLWRAIKRWLRRINRR